MDTVLTIAGAALIVVGLLDTYQSLVHPSGTGFISTWVMRSLWAFSRRMGHRLGSAIGPAIMVAVLILWVVMQVLGWALVYLPHVPAGFSYSPGIEPARYPDFLEAAYISSVTLATLGFGDVVATNAWLRFLSPFEGLAGFALLTAALTWFTQVYPPLSRRRSLALELKGLADVHYPDAVPDLDPRDVTRVLDTLASQVVVARIDFTQHAETYYFQEEDPCLSLARQIHVAVRIQRAAASGATPDLRLSAARLEAALDELASKLQDGFLTSADDGEVFAAYAADHGRRGNSD
ncbi:two pore domain potassium channel family protein [Arthrobacter agilis]|uniref:potassium channel family protein n=1 Tax=Arthrobacter agilis TaxID=37921 RepID=UPI000B363DC1|nr:potassium channel family protein [Arthrobacter agilis]OUM43594.1 transporter [Arthrobacter agilis]PPB46819.1 two pore domain potassium channel family protein [Arthrobacter agilis]TPV24841.1 two pore domain potassium channel family protein [Arthrobacter agilis]VDR30990.1 Ion channel [Arthrobacter agilis]